MRSPSPDRRDGTARANAARPVHACSHRAARRPQAAAPVEGARRPASWRGADTHASASRAVSPIVRPRHAISPPHQHAQHSLIGFRKLQAGIAAGEQDQLNVTSQRRLLAWIECVIHLHADQPAAHRSRRTAQIMLAGGKEHRVGGNRPCTRIDDPTHRLEPQVRTAEPRNTWLPRSRPPAAPRPIRGGSSQQPETVTRRMPPCRCTPTALA